MLLDRNGFAAALAAERGFVVFKDFAAIPLKRSKGLTGVFAKVSIEDRHLGRYYWSTSRYGYCRRRLNDSRAILMHREVMGCEPGDGLLLDHINRDPLDNRRSNLRFVTQAENMQNQGRRQGGTSEHRGVSYRSADRKWVVVHGLNGKAVYAGAYDTEQEAVAAAKAWRDEHMPFSGDSSRHRGVCWDRARGKWKAAARLNYETFNLGRFDTEEEAVAAVRAFRAERMPFAVD